MGLMKQHHPKFSLNPQPPNHSGRFRSYGHGSLIGTVEAGEARIEGVAGRPAAREDPAHGKSWWWLYADLNAHTHTHCMFIYIIHKIRLYLSIDSFATHCARQLWLAYFQLPLAPIFSQRTSTDQVDPPHIIQWSPAAMPGRTWCLGEAHHSACWDNQSPHGLNGPGWIIRSIRFENWFLPPVMARNTSYK